MKKKPSVSKASSSPLSENRLLLIDVSNSFTKIVMAKNGILGPVRKIPTSLLTTGSKKKLPKLPQADRVVISSVVPKANESLEQSLSGFILWVNHRTAGVDICYPKPTTIGADRLANVAATLSLGKLPAIIVDFGTAVTFDVIDASGCYLGGIIAPGLSTAAAALHERTALLPLTKIRRITSPVGKSTQQGIQIGLLLGAVGIVREVVARVKRETFKGKQPNVLATGGDAHLVDRLSRLGGGEKIIDLVDPLLTLKGLFVIAGKN